MGYHPMVECAKNLAWMENMRLDPNESCLDQRYNSTQYANVGPTMTSVPAAEKIPPFHWKRKVTP